MIDKSTEKEVPEAVRKIIAAMSGQAIARCHREGIALEDFYRAMLEERAIDPKSSVANLFDRAFQRLKGTTN
jgi:hypothetical protein